MGGAQGMDVGIGGQNVLVAQAVTALGDAAPPLHGKDHVIGTRPFQLFHYSTVEKLEGAGPNEMVFAMERGSGISQGMDVGIGGQNVLAAQALVEQAQVERLPLE